jgi:serine phosphatase RsbU (regulator of sigma subunit)
VPTVARSQGRELGEGRRLLLIRIAGVAVVYYGAAKLGLGLAFTTESVTAIWAPTGLALAAVVLWGYGVWPGIALGAFLANVSTNEPVYTALGISAGNTLEALFGAYLLGRVGFRPTLLRVRDVVALVTLAALVSTMVSATIGVVSLLAGDLIEAGDIAVTWRTWWLGDMGGDLVVAPALLIGFTHFPYRRAPGGPFEAVGVAALIAGVTAIVFTSEIPLTFLILPPLIVAAMRFWQPGAAAGCLLVAAIAIPLTADALGPFSENSPDERLLLAQALIGTTSLTMLLLAAVVTERSRVEHALGNIAETLQESLLPSRLPEIPGFEVAIDYRPAGERQIVGGDFYDAFPAEDGSWAAVVGDAVGKGASAAATTALARYTLRAIAMNERHPRRVLHELNRAIERQVPGQTCTVAYLRLEPEGDGGARMTVANAGHPAPLVLRANGVVENVARPGLMLGADPNLQLVDHDMRLAPGDAVVIYTDGLTDAYAPARRVSVDDLSALLAGCAGLGATAIAARLVDSVLDPHAPAPRDDILLLALRVAPAGG